MGRTKIKMIFESDTLTAMEILDFILLRLAFKKHEWNTPLLLRSNPLIEITDYMALDWKGKEKRIAKRHVPKIEISRISEVLKAVGGGLFTVGHYLIDNPTRLMYIILGGVVLYGVITAWLSGGII